MRISFVVIIHGKDDVYEVYNCWKKYRGYTGT